MASGTTNQRELALKLVLVPAMLTMLMFFVTPLVILLRYSVADFDGGVIGTSFSIKHYIALFTDPLYQQIILRTIGIAAVTTILCVVCGYPIAWGIVQADKRWRPVPLVLVLTPLLVGGVIRCYGWMLILDERGLVNNFLVATGWIDSPKPLLFGFWSVVVAMVEVLLPFFVLPMLGSLSSIDPLLAKASLSLGASRSETFFKIIFPLSLPGVVAGASIIFSLALTIFVVPRVIGGPSYLMLATLANQQVAEVGNMPLGSAVSVLMLALTLIVHFMVPGAAKRSAN